MGQIEEKHEHIQGRGIIRDIALGLSDGVVTNVAFLAGFAGANTSVGVLRFAGIAAMLAGAVSMFFGGLMAGRAERDLFRADSKRELSEIEQEPEEEKLELKNFYVDKGLTKEESEIVVRRITKNKQKWLEDLLMHEMYIHEKQLERPLKVAGVTGLSFLLGAFVPLVGYLAFSTRSYSIVASVAISLIFLFTAGGWKGKVSGRRFWASGSEMLLVGAAASAILFVIGSLLVFV
ncbi:MAG: VIT1/CCC1 transporter family protein [Nitrososphaerales archaeon]